MGKKPVCSILILHYKVPKLLKECVENIKRYPPKDTYEIIVIDNDKKNVGFGAGFNKGIKKSKGEYLFFLNPDVIVTKNSLNLLYDFLKTHPKAAIASSLLVSEKGEINPRCASYMLNPWNAFLLHSKFRRLFVHTNTVKNFFIPILKNSLPVRADAVQTACFCMRKKDMQEMGGFDENFFLFFEEYDLAQRIKQRGQEAYIIPKSLVIHTGEESMKKNPKASWYFKKSRFYYFEKYYGHAVSKLLHRFL